MSENTTKAYKLVHFIFSVVGLSKICTGKEIA
jgi:hypothetical protein